MRQNFCLAVLAATRSPKEGRTVPKCDGLETSYPRFLLALGCPFSGPEQPMIHCAISDADVCQLSLA